MKKNLLILLSSLFIFSGCFSIQSLNPFSDDSAAIEKKEIETPSDSPSWLENRYVENHISAIGLTKNVNDADIELHRKKALIIASNNYLKKVYIKSVNIYKDYIEKLDNPNVYDKDIKNVAKQIALKTLKLSKIRNSWINKESNELYIQIATESNSIAIEIQEGSKQLFKNDTLLYENFLSNRAKEQLIEKINEQ